MKILARVISMTGKALTPEQLQRFGPRIEYVNNTFVPQIRSIGLDVEVFPAVTPNDDKIRFVDNSVDIEYDGMVYQRGTMRDGQPASINQMVLVFGHLQLWKESIRTQTPILVFEDDAFLKTEYTSSIANSIQQFLNTIKDSDPSSILYLQSTCPWRSGKPLKHYDPWAIHPIHDFFKIHPQWHDVSGTTAYMVHPKSAEFLVNHFTTHPIWSIDGMMDDSKRNGTITFYIPKDYTKTFEIHPVFG